MLNLVTTITKHDLDSRSAQAWAQACDQVGLVLQTRTATARGVVGGYDVTLAVVSVDGAMHTKYGIALDAPHAPYFRLTASDQSPTDQDLAFEDLAVEGADDGATGTRLTMHDFLTAERRRLMTETVTRWQSAVVSTGTVVVSSEGIESDPELIVSTIDHLVALAEAISPCWTEVALDEGSVLGDLFHPSRSVDDAAERFEQLYRASDVTWSGEVLQVGAIEKQGRRAVVLVGASKAPVKFGTMWGGRVVAITLLDPDVSVAKGSVVTFSGGLRNLDAAKRLFRIEDSSNWELREPLFDAL